MFLYIWKYHVAAEKTSDFEAAYGPDGAWTRLFRRDPAYLGTELLRDPETRTHYLTIDRWRSSEACRSFRDRHGDEMAAIDARGEEWTLSERLVGEFDVVSKADTE